MSTARCGQGTIIAIDEDIERVGLFLVRRSPSPVLWEDFNKMSESEKQAYIAEMKNAEQEAIQKKEIDQTTTVIHKIAISNGAITYIARGDVPGILESQFSMDEYKNNLRVATTSNVYTTRGSYQYNNVFVLDSGMKTIGSLDPHRRAGEDLLGPVHRRPALPRDLQAGRPVLRDRPLDPDKPEDPRQAQDPRLLGLPAPLRCHPHHRYRQGDRDQ